MKRTITLVLAILMLVSLFAGCGGSGTTTPTQAPASAAPSAAPAATKAPASAAPASSAPESSAPAEETPEEPASPYPFAVDERGIAVEPYDYPLPLTTSDEVLSYWTTIYTPQYITEDGGFGDTALPKEAERRTGVHVEYVCITSANRGENFSVLLASDELCDMMCCASSFYKGTPLEMVEEGYFVNVYDYKEFMPNFFYEATYHYPDDQETRDAIYYFSDFVPIVPNLSICIGEMNGGYCFRKDWLDKIGVRQEDVVTWDDLEDTLKKLKVAVDTCDYPMWFHQGLEMSGYWQFTSFGSMTSIPTSVMPTVYMKDGVVQFGCTTTDDKKLMEKIVSFYQQGLISPNWASFAVPGDICENSYHGEVAYMYWGANTIRDGTKNNLDPECEWIATQKPLVQPGQILHNGISTARTSSGNCSFAANNTDLELCLKWIDYRYSPEGHLLYTYGPEGVVVDIDENGNYHNTEFVLNHPDGFSFTWLVFLYAMDPFVDPGMPDLRVKFYNPDGDIARNAIATWTDWLNENYDAAGLYPKGAHLDSEQSEELDQYRSNLVTYIAENFSSFVDGSKPMSEFDSYLDTLYDIGLQEVIDIYQEAYVDYLNRG